MALAPRGKFAGLLEMSARRAFRLRIEPDEVLPSERAALELAQPPITEKNLQAFLAWRRSVLLVVAVVLVPLTILRLIDAFSGEELPAMLRVVGVLPALAEAVFAGVCIYQLRNWTNWRKQRRAILLAWLVFLLTPFLVFLYPLRHAVESPEMGEAAAGLGMVFAIFALLSLAPKAVSLLPGLVRAALVSKMQFPGTAGPGWLIVMAAPIYAIFAFLLLIVPYQITGSGWFVAAMLGVIVAQGILARAGFQLARPTTESVAIAQIKRVRATYLTAAVASTVFLIIALASLVKAFDIGYLVMFTTILAFLANVLILTMIGSDLLITNLDHARTLSQGTATLVEESNLKLASFVGGSEPPTPPPPF